MVLKRGGYCIFSCGNKRCINDSTETFKDVICPHHLSQVFGLKIAIDKFETESYDHLVGPYLIVDESFSFKPHTVVFPERDYIDQFMNLTEQEQPDSYKYKLNPRMSHYLSTLQTDTEINEARYQLEILRNLFFVVDNDAVTNYNFSSQINLAKQTESSHKLLKVELETRFQQLNSIVRIEDYNKSFEKITVFSMNENGKIPLKNFTPFMSFMIFNCVIDEHKLPVTDKDAAGLMCFLNLVYVKGVGFVTTQEILHPSHLVVAGKTIGNNSYYQLKVRSYPKRVIQNTNVYKRSLADNIRSSNLLNSPSDFCFTK